MFSEAGAIRFAVCISLSCLFAASASAVPFVRIDSPANGTEYPPGTNFNATVSFGNSVAGVQRLDVTLDGVGWSYSYPASPPTRSGSQVVPLTVPAGAAPGQSMTLLATLTDYVDGPFQTFITIRTPAPDTEAPTYAGDAGIISAVRTNGYQSANLNWNQAVDNVTATNDIVYNIYYSDNATLLAQAVELGTAQTTITGLLSTTINGLDPAKNYIFVVTAEDEAGNEEYNYGLAQARLIAIPDFGSVSETFTGWAGAATLFDHYGADNETVSPSLDTGFRWGAYDAGTEFGDNILSGVNPWHLAFNQSARAVGSYAYTRLDDTTLPFVPYRTLPRPLRPYDSTSNWPSMILDLSSPEAKATIVGDHESKSGLSSTVAVLLRDDSGWWQSTGKVVGSDETTLEFNFGLSALTWNQVSNGDIDDVDDGGEGTLSVGAAGTPNFENIEGMGIRILSATGSTSTTKLRVLSMSLEGPVVTAAESWTQYR